MTSVKDTDLTGDRNGMQSSLPPNLTLSSNPSWRRLRGPILALVVGVLLTMEMFQVPLYSVFSGMDTTVQPLGSRPSMLETYLIPLVNLALMVWAGALLVLQEPGLGTAQRACLLLTCLVGAALASVEFGYRLSIIELEQYYNRLDAVSDAPPVGLATFLHSLLAIAWLAWLAGPYQRYGKTISRQQARAAAWAVTIALVCWGVSGQQLNSPAPLLVGLTALLCATVQAARMHRTSKDGTAASSEAPNPAL